MRRILVLALLVSIPTFAGGKTRVRAHVTKSGAYVPAHSRTKADSTKSNNWSTKGNVNPETGKEGTK